MTEHERALAALAEMEAKASAATAGPWHKISYRDINPTLGVLVYQKPARPPLATVHDQPWNNERNADFIASVRTDAPRAYAALRAVLGQHQGKWPQMGGTSYGPCRECDQIWPCPTVRAIAEKLEVGK